MGLRSARSPTFAPILRSRAFLVPFALILVLLTIIYSPLPAVYDAHRDALLGEIAGVAKGHFSSTPPPAWHPLSLEHVRSKYAFASFLAGEAETNEDADTSFADDQYFVATRLLAYQILHAPETRSRDESIPFVVLVTSNVSERKRARLRKDGAIVVPAEFVSAAWVKTDNTKWQDVMTKLRLWELTQFERICFVDGDTVLVEPLDGIFQDPALVSRPTGQKEDQRFEDESEMPATYSFAGVPEMNRQHHFPPTDANHDFPNIAYLNAGFFVFEPSLTLLSYYLSLINTVNKFNPEFPEQNLLNYAHRGEGNMPWQQLGNTWNIHYPTVDDLHQGAKSLHEKWWDPENKDLQSYLETWRWRMEGYFEARDARFVDSSRADRWQD